MPVEGDEHSSSGFERRGHSLQAWLRAAGHRTPNGFSGQVGKHCAVIRSEGRDRHHALLVSLGGRRRHSSTGVRFQRLEQHPQSKLRSYQTDFRYLPDSFVAEAPGEKV